MDELIKQIEERRTSFKTDSYSMSIGELVNLYENNENINGGFISNAPDVETLFNYRQWKHSKFYNGPLECSFYKIARL